LFGVAWGPKLGPGDAGRVEGPVGWGLCFLGPPPRSGNPKIRTGAVDSVRAAVQHTQ
jgi:hypothetical protein